MARVEKHGALYQSDLDEIRAPLENIMREFLPAEFLEIFDSAADAGEDVTRREAREAGMFRAPLPGAGEDEG